MRTKTLLLAAVLSAAGALPSLAQGTVYSVNAVGYVNLPVVGNGFQIFANPLDNKNANGNTVSNLFAAAPDGVVLYRFNPVGGTYSANQKIFGNWDAPGDVIAPGEGVFIFNGGTAFTNTFVGDVPQGALQNAIPAGFSIKASQVPQAGGLSTPLEFPAADGDAVYIFNTATQGYDAFTYQFGSWAPSEPTLAVGQGFFVNKAAVSSWNRTFSVNTP